MLTSVRDQGLFQLEGELIIPNVLARGNRYPNSQHGGSMIALIARAAEQHPSDAPRLVSRLTVDMMRCTHGTRINTGSRCSRRQKG